MNLRTQKIEKCVALKTYDHNNKFIERFQSRNLKLFQKAQQQQKHTRNTLILGHKSMA